MMILLSLFSIFALADLKHRDVPAPTDDDSRPSNTLQKSTSNKPTGAGNGSSENTASEAVDGTSAGACSQKHSIETFMQVSSAYSPQSGKAGKLYFLSDFRDVPQLYELKTPQTWPKQISFFPDGVSYYRVSPDGKKLVMATQHGGDENYQIYLFEPFDNDRLTPLLTDEGVRIESVTWSPDSTWFAFTSNKRNKIDMDLYRFQLNEKKSEILKELSGQNVASDVSPDQNWVAIENFVSETDSQILLYNLKTKQTINPTEEEADAVHEHPIFTADSKHFLALAEDEKGFRQLLLYTFDGRKKKRLTSFGWDVEPFELDQTRSYIVYRVNKDGYTDLHANNLQASGDLGTNLSTPQTRNGVVSSAAFAFDKPKSIFYAFSSSNQSSDIFQWSSPREIQWTNSTHGLIEKGCFSKEILVRYPTFDGLKIPAFLYLPRGASGASRIPFIVYAHGGPEAQYRPSFNRIFQYFLERGYGVFAPNIRGSTGYGRTYTQLDNYKKRMDSVRDLVEGAKWLLEKHYSAPGRLGIYGGSYGGFLVLRSIEEAPDLFAAASESVGIANFVTFLKNTSAYRRALREVEFGPLSDEKFLLSISPISYIDRIKTPLLIFHGANDPRVPVAETEQMVEALKKRRVTVDYKIYPDEGHGSRKLHNLMDQATTTVYFFEKHMSH